MYVARLCKRHITYILSTLLVILLCLTFARILEYFGSRHKYVYLEGQASFAEKERKDKSDELKNSKYGYVVEIDPVDMVYIWLNSSDPDIVRELEAYSSTEYKTPQEILALNRYKDWGTLKYSLRSVEKFATWIRTIHIVTNGQIPTWLALDDHRINIIAHKEIFPNRSDLPTFSSAAIECHLHRIFGLSKRFIYMRDDVILTDTLELSYFYEENDGYKLRLVKDGMENCNPLCRVIDVNNGVCEAECVTASCELDGEDCRHVNKMPVYPGTTNNLVIYNNWDSSMRHTSFILNKVFEPSNRFMPLPGVYMLNKDIAANMVDSFHDDLRKTSSTKVFNNMTFLPMFAYHNYLKARNQLQLGKSEIKTSTVWSNHEVGNNGFSIRQKDFIINLLTKVIKGQGQFIVLSNYFPDILYDAEKETRDSIFTTVFDDMFPSPSQFEIN